MDDLVNRVEAKALMEKEITDKISVMRSKLRSSSTKKDEHDNCSSSNNKILPDTMVKLFETTKTK